MSHQTSALRGLLSIGCAGLALAHASTADAIPAGYKYTGTLEAQFIDLPGGQVNAANSQDLDTANETKIILNYLDANPGFTGVTPAIGPGGQTYSITTNATVKDGGPINWDTGGDYSGDRNSNTVGQTIWPGAAGHNNENYIIRYKGHILFQPGNYTLNFNSDDGGVIDITGAVFGTQYGENTGDEDSGGVLSNSNTRLLFNDVSGGHQTGGQLSFATETVVGFDAWFFERAGGEFWEVSVANSLQTSFSTANFSILQDGLFNNSIQFVVPIPEPATMSLLALGGLAMMRRRRTA